MNVPLTMARERALETYRHLLVAEPADLVRLANDVFSPDAVLAATALRSPVSGPLAIGQQLHRIVHPDREVDPAPASVRPVTEVQWAHHTVRWCWRVSEADRLRRGMDVITFAHDSALIELVAVFDGMLPPSA